MSKWHDTTIREAVDAGLAKYYKGKFNSDTTIYDFTYSDCHSYYYDYYNEFYERKKIAPNADVLIKKWKDAIKKRIDPQKHHLTILDEIRVFASRSIINGENPTIFTLFRSVLYKPFDNEPSVANLKSELNYSNYLEEFDFKGIAIGVLDTYFLKALEEEQTKLYPVHLFDTKTSWKEAYFWLVNDFIRASEPNIKENASIYDLALSRDFENKFKEDFSVRIKIAPDKIKMINRLILEKENLYIDKPNNSRFKDNKLSITKAAFEHITKGENPRIEDFFWQHLAPEYYDYSQNTNRELIKLAKFEYRFLDYIVRGVSDAHQLSFLKKELEMQQSLDIKSQKMTYTFPENEKVNKAHLVRGLFEILTTIGGNHDKTTIAKLAFFLINGKTAVSKKEYQPLLNAISSQNKQPNNKTVKAEKGAIKSYLKDLGLLKEKK